MLYCLANDPDVCVCPRRRFELIRNRIQLCALFLLYAVSVAPAVEADESAAQGTIDSFHETLLGVMRKAEVLGFAGRRDELDPVVKQSFDLSFIASIVTGRYWKSLGDADRSQMVETFTRLTIATYAARFDSYSGQEFKIVAVRPKKRERMLVRSEIRDVDGDVVQLDYVLHRAQGEWKIINVIADGVSDLSIKRADYSSVLRASGFEALLSRLNEQIDSLARSS